MKRLLMLLACLLAATRLLPAAGNDSTLKVMTFNVRCVVESDGANQWKFRKDYAADLVKFYAPDLWGAQEATWQQMLDLQERLPQYSYIGVGRDDGKNGGEFSPIFYLRSRFDLLNDGHFWLAEKDKMNTPGAKGWDADYPRVATWGIFRDKMTGRKFFYLNTHLDHAGPEARRRGAQLIIEQTRLLAGNLPVIVTGDFNAVPEDEPIRILTGKSNTGAFVHTRDIAALPYGPDWTFHDFGRIPAENRQWLDYIFVRGNWTVVLNASLTDNKGNLYPSDHCPVLAEMLLR